VTSDNTNELIVVSLNSLSKSATYAEKFQSIHSSHGKLMQISVYSCVAFASAVHFSTRKH